MSLTIRNPIPFAIAFTAAAAVTQTGLLELSKRFAQVEKVGSGDCFQDIVAKYPGMDSASYTIAKIFCMNDVHALDAGFVSISDQGSHGMRDALKQNTVLKSFKIIVDCLQTPVDQDCQTTFANDMVSALKVNRGLETLNLQMAFPYKVLATQELFSNLPCMNIHSLTFTSPIAPTAAPTVFSKIFSQKFPLATFSWNTCLDPVDDTVGSIISSLTNGLKDNSCLKTLDLSENSFNATTITTLFGGIAASKIKQFLLPQFVDENGNRSTYAFSDEQTAAILEAVRSNPCFLECLPTVDPLPEDLEAGIQNITKSRGPCPLDLECRVSKSCPIPPVPHSYTFLEGSLIGGFTGAILTGLLALGSYAACNWRRQTGEEQPLLQTVQ